MSLGDSPQMNGALSAIVGEVKLNEIKGRLSAHTRKVFSDGFESSHLLALLDVACRSV